MPATQPEKPSEGRHYWTHKVESFPSSVSVTRMAQLIDFDDRLYETARVVYRFLISWYHGGYGDAFMSMNHVAKTMKQRAPVGAAIPSRSAVHRAIIALMETGWVVRTFKGRGKGKGASRYVPVMNVLELAAQGKFPQPSHATGTVEPSHLNGTVVSHATGTVDAQPSHATGIKTLLHDPRTDAETCKEEVDFAPPAPALAGGAAAKEGFDELFDAYGVRKEYAAGKVEYEKLAPSPDLHVEIVLAAKAWRAAAGGIERMHLARWLREQRFREEPKGSRKPTKASANSKTSTSKAKQPKPKPQPQPQMPGQNYRIKDAVIESDEFGNETLKIALEGETSTAERSLAIVVQHQKSGLQVAGQHRLTSLLTACGITTIDGPGELLGHSIYMDGDGKVSPSRPAAVACNDNDPRREAA